MTPVFRYAHSDAAPWEQAARSCIQQLGEFCERANLGFVYFTDALAEHAPALLLWLHTQMPEVHWVGAAGSGVCAGDREYYDVPALAIMLGALPSDAFRVLPTVIHGGAGIAGARHVKTLGIKPHTAIVHGDPKNLEIADLIDALAAQMDSGFLLGGLTSVRGSAHAQVADHLTRGGLSGVVFSPQVTLTAGLTQGCTPLGGRHRITRSHRNLLIELDGLPALEVFKEDIGELLSRDLNRVGGYIYAALPVPGSDRGDYTVRALLGIDPEQQVIAIGELVEPGGSVLFCRRDAAGARDDTLRMLREIGTRLQGPPAGGLYFSCVGRGRSLFGPDSAELKLIREELGEFPLVGLYCSGEIYHDHLYGYTGVLVLFCDEARASVRGRDVKKAM